MPVVGFGTADDFDRVAKAVRREEARSRSDDPARPSRRGPGPDPLFVKVTGAADGDGYYPAVFTLWDSDAEDWSDTAGVCQAIAVDGSALTTGSRHLGRVAGTVAAAPLVIVAAGGPWVCLEVLSGPPSCADGEWTFPTKWIRFVGFVSDTEPAECA